MFYKKISFMILIVLIGSLLCVKVEAHDPNVYFTESSVAIALGVYTAADGEMDKKWRALERLEIEYAMLGVQWNDNQQEMIKNAIRAGNAIQLDILGSATSTTTNMAESMIDITDQHKLGVALTNKVIEIETQNVAVATAVTEQGRAHAHYKAHYDVHKTKQSQVEDFVERGTRPVNLPLVILG